MKFELKIISIALLLFAVTGNAFAGAWGRPRPQQEFRGQQRQQRQNQQQQVQRGPQAPNPVAGGQPHPLFGGNGPGWFGPAGANFNNQAGTRKFGPRMSVEERQQLRRQINEAGQDIYAPRK